ncbi:MAG: sialate O-acetylesterase [Flavobacteriaceae bacterium]
MKKIIVLFNVVLCCQCIGSKKIAKEESNPMEIYLLIGQSNMAGRATIELQDKDSINNVFLFTGNDIKPWEKAANPLNKYSTVRKRMSMQKLGPGYGFALEMAKTRKGKDIRLVVNAKGGTSIDEWKPGDTLYNEAVNQTKKALKTGGVLKGIIWHQGEANARTYKAYMPKIIVLIESLRKDYNLPNLPFVAGQLSPDKPHRLNFNKMILELPNKVKHTEVVTTENTTTIDETHFDSESQRLLGKRYAEALLTLIKN